METQATEIARWNGRISMSTAQRTEDLKIRTKFTRWYDNDFWKTGVAGMDETDPDQRQTNFTGMFVRAMEANMYAQAPTYSCVTPGNPNVLNQLFAIVAGNIPEHVGLRRTVQMCSLDAILGRFAIAQVGFDAKLGWDASGEDRERQRAQEENERFGREDVTVKKHEAHDVHIKEHASARQRLLEATPTAPPVGVIGEMDRHMRAHAEAKKKQLASPLEYVESRRAWVTRIRPVVNGKVAFGWETDTPFEEACWMWRAWCRPLSELKSDPGLNTRELQGTQRRLGGLTKTEFSDLEPLVKSSLTPDVEMVVGYEIIDRNNGKRLICAEGHDNWLYNASFDHADLFRASGFHLLTYLPATGIGSGKTPIEDAASHIIAINNGEGMLIDVLRQSVSSKIYDMSKMDGKQAEKIQRRGIGDLIGIKFKGNVDDIRKATTDIQGARLPSENLAALSRADGGVGQALGTGDAVLGGGDDSKTATAAHVSATSTTGVMEHWAGRQGCWIANITSDVNQLVKKHYTTPDAMRELLPPHRIDEWQQMRQMMSPEPEVLRVDAGSTMPGREGKKREEAMALLQVAGQIPLVKVRPVLEDVFKAFGRDPSRYMLSEQEEQAMAAQQPGPQTDAVGGGEMAPQPGGQRPSESQSPQDIQREVRSNAAERSAAAQ